uniref:Transcription cofactor vestigial-like protein 2 n=1 Tax=Gadus morhua TaxID=8049 RepID=A0A8C5CRN9_GADMO
MSCLDVMYQVYGSPPQPYFATAYSPYHHQKLAFYSKMQESHDGAGRCSEEDCGRDKEPSPEAEYLSGDISTVVDEHFSRALSQSSGYASSHDITCTNSTSPPPLSPSDGPFPMNQRSFPPSFWNSTYQSSGPSGLGAPHAELSFPGTPTRPRPRCTATSTAQPRRGLAPLAPPPPPHHHPYSLGAPSGARARRTRGRGVHEVYGPAFVPALRLAASAPRCARTTTRLAASSSVPGPGGSPCDLGGKGESGPASAWSGAFAGASPDIALNMDTGLQTQDKSKDLYWF